MEFMQNAVMEFIQKHLMRFRANAVSRALLVIVVAIDGAWMALANDIVASWMRLSSTLKERRWQHRELNRVCVVSKVRKRDVA